VASLFGALTVAAAVMSWPSAPQLSGSAPVEFRAAMLPTPAHIVIVVEENRSQSNIIGNKAAPFINRLAAGGAMMSQSFAEVHPSEPNYYALFAGNTLVTENDGSIAQGDQWLYQNLSQYASWARANNSLLILTWDEDDNTSRNQIPTVIYGGNVRPGSYDRPISHYNVLSTVEQMYGLPKLGYATRAPAITDIWGA
jgi:hypothetical protein